MLVLCRCSQYEKAEGGLNLEELFILCTNLSNKVLALETSRYRSGLTEILKLKIQIKSFEKEKGGSTEELVSTAVPKTVSTGRPELSTTRPDVDVARQEDIEEEKAQGERVSIKDIEILQTEDHLPEATFQQLTLKQSNYKLDFASTWVKGKIEEEESSKDAIVETYVNVKQGFDDDCYMDDRSNSSKEAAGVHKQKIINVHLTVIKFFVLSDLEQSASTTESLDLMEVLGRFESTTPEGVDLVLWGDLRTMFDANTEDELWFIQKQINEYGSNDGSEKDL
ncbi:hypothetical protein Tco_0583431 [Tanacetum coccineum]